MTARMIEEAEQRLRRLKQDEWSRLALAALAMGLALLATVVHPPFAIPLLLGALTVGVLAAHAFLERADLAHELLLERDAYLIPEIRHKAQEIASMESRRALAQVIRRKLAPLPGFSVTPRVAEAAEELKALACELDDERLLLDPACAVQCAELITSYTASPLINELLPADDLHVTLRQIRQGFAPGSRA
jgi:hypothetical protein